MGFPNPPIFQTLQILKNLINILLETQIIPTTETIKLLKGVVVIDRHLTRIIEGKKLIKINAFPQDLPL